MNRWPTKPLGEVVEISRERIEPIEHPDLRFNYIGLESIEGHTGNLLPYQLTSGVEIKSTKNVFHRGEILYGKLRPYLNKVHLAVEDGICSTDIYVLRPHRRQMHPSFAAYYLRSHAVLAVLSNAMAGANLPRISHESLLGIPIPVPPLEEQERIVTLLDEADELRKLRAKADRRTAELILSIFDSMFGDTIINPRGWPIERLGKLAEVIMGQAPPGDACNHDNDGVPFVKAGEFGETRPLIREWTTKPLRMASASDVLVCVVGATSGKLNLGADCAIGRSVGAIRPAPSVIEQNYLYVLLQRWTQVLRSGSQGSAQGVITKEMLERIPVPLPPLSGQQEFTKRVSEIRRLEADQAACRCRLDDLFQSLLHHAFQGDL